MADGTKRLDQAQGGGRYKVGGVLVDANGQAVKEPQAQTAQTSGETSGKQEAQTSSSGSGKTSGSGAKKDA